jgi:uncharacterized protein (TIGR03437 family)
VVAAAPGITTYNGSGVTQHAASGQLVTYTNSAEPNEVIIIWGSGFGATTDSDTSYTSSRTKRVLTTASISEAFWRTSPTRADPYIRE